MGNTKGKNLKEYFGKKQFLNLEVGHDNLLGTFTVMRVASPSQDLFLLKVLDPRIYDEYTDIQEAVRKLNQEHPQVSSFYFVEENQQNSEVYDLAFEYGEPLNTFIYEESQLWIFVEQIVEGMIFLESLGYHYPTLSKQYIIQTGRNNVKILNPYSFSDFMKEILQIYLNPQNPISSRRSYFMMQISRNIKEMGVLIATLVSNCNEYQLKSDTSYANKVIDAISIKFSKTLVSLMRQLIHNQNQLKNFSDIKQLINKLKSQLADESSTANNFGNNQTVSDTGASSQGFQTQGQRAQLSQTQNQQAKVESGQFQKPQTTIKPDNIYSNQAQISERKLKIFEDLPAVGSKLYSGTTNIEFNQSLIVNQENISSKKSIPRSTTVVNPDFNSVPTKNTPSPSPSLYQSQPQFNSNQNQQPWTNISSQFLQVQLIPQQQQIPESQSNNLNSQTGIKNVQINFQSLQTSLTSSQLASLLQTKQTQNNNETDNFCRQSRTKFTPQTMSRTLSSPNPLMVNLNLRENPQRLINVTVPVEGQSFPVPKLEPRTSNPQNIANEQRKSTKIDEKVEEFAENFRNFENEIPNLSPSRKYSNNSEPIIHPNEKPQFLFVNSNETQNVNINSYIQGIESGITNSPMTDTGAGFFKNNDFFNMQDTNKPVSDMASQPFYFKNNFKHYKNALPEIVVDVSTNFDQDKIPITINQRNEIQENRQLPEIPEFKNEVPTFNEKNSLPEKTLSVPLNPQQTGTNTKQDQKQLSQPQNYIQSNQIQPQISPRKKVIVKLHIKWLPNEERHQKIVEYDDKSTEEIQMSEEEKTKYITGPKPLISQLNRSPQPFTVPLNQSQPLQQTQPVFDENPIKGSNVLAYNIPGEFSIENSTINSGVFQSCLHFSLMPQGSENSILLFRSKPLQGNPRFFDAAMVVNKRAGISPSMYHNVDQCNVTGGVFPKKETSMNELNVIKKQEYSKQVSMDTLPRIEKLAIPTVLATNARFIKRL